MAKDTGQAVNTVDQSPWEPQGNRLKTAFGQGDMLFGADTGNWAKGERSLFPGQSYVGFSPETTQALDMTANRAREGSPVMNGANQLSMDTLNGKFLGEGNPYLDSMFNRGARSVTDQFTKSVVPSINSTFALAGRYGSNSQKEMLGQANDNLGRTLSEMYTDMAMPTYEAERQRQMQTMGQAPQLAQADYADAQQLGQVGATKEGLSEAALADQMKRFDFEQNKPVDALTRYMSLLQGNYGGAQSQTSPIYRNRGAGMLGGGLAGAQLGSMFGPWGSLIGGVGGAALGY